VLLVTHDVDEALILADRVLVLADGRITHDCRVDEPRPRHRDQPELVSLRTQLLGELGISTEGTV
jgi:sulfonate transport system ATP-binding protein